MQAVEVSSEFCLVGEACALARKFRLSAYAAVCLEITRRLHLPLATLDLSLAATAKLAKIDAFP